MVALAPSRNAASQTTEPRVVEVVVRRFAFEPATIEAVEGRAPSCPGSIGGRPARLRDQAVQGVEGSSARERTGNDRVHRVRGRYLPDPVFALLRRRSRRYEGRPGRHRPGCCSSIGVNTRYAVTTFRHWSRFCARFWPLVATRASSPLPAPHRTSRRRSRAFNAIFSRRPTRRAGRPVPAATTLTGAPFEPLAWTFRPRATHASLVGVASRQQPERASRRSRRPREQLSHPEDRSTGRYRRRAHAAARAVSDGRTDRDHQALDRAWREETTEERLRLMTRLLLLIVDVRVDERSGTGADADPRRRTIPIST